MLVLDIHNALSPEDQTYFRQSRETRLGKSLEAAVSGREERLPHFRKSLASLRALLAQQEWIGGPSPLYADYLVFGALQWAKVISDFRVLADDDPVAAWFERCSDLHGGLGRKILG